MNPQSTARVVAEDGKFLRHDIGRRADRGWRRADPRIAGPGSDGGRFGAEPSGRRDVREVGFGRLRGRSSSPSTTGKPCNSGFLRQPAARPRKPFILPIKRQPPNHRHEVAFGAEGR